MSLIFSNLVDLKSGSECELYLLQVMIRIAFFCNLKIRPHRYPQSNKP